MIHHGTATPSLSQHKLEPYSYLSPTHSNAFFLLLLSRVSFLFTLESICFARWSSQHPYPYPCSFISLPFKFPRPRIFAREHVLLSSFSLRSRSRLCSRQPLSCYALHASRRAWLFCIRHRLSHGRRHARCHAYGHAHGGWI